MIVGTVTADREATIRLRVQDQQGREHDIVAVLDTGFTGSITLPPVAITTLGLPWRSRARVVLANGAEDECDIYAATIIWDGAPRRILVESAPTDPLVGMTLLYGHEVHLQVVPGGTVTIEALP